ncbi:hypothetical protein BJY28_001173 [Janibacter alkaliphilus]|uniref:Uncharacterized protein n=1 Tax=Janibacter alkaliphilus TaxID=1069963 RepID=A0A852X8Q4_9MICO|nr:hypothetical protein [Janibacter alkaliphilus]
MVEPQVRVELTVVLAVGQRQGEGGAEVSMTLE